MKTAVELKTLAITRTNAEGKTEIVKLIDCKCPGRMWALMKGQALFNQYGADVTITAYKTDDTPYMQFTLEKTKGGHMVMKQHIVENRRGQILKAKREANAPTEATEVKVAAKKQPAAPQHKGRAVKLDNPKDESAHLDSVEEAVADAAYIAAVNAIIDKG